MSNTGFSSYVYWLKKAKIRFNKSQNDYSRQKKQVFAHSLGISFWQRLHIKPCSRIAWQVWQKSFRISVLFSGCFRRLITIWSISVNTSLASSSGRWLPLSLPMYLLTADCDSPRMLAVCFSFKPCFSTIDLAIMALTAGKTVLTPTSHGSIKFLHRLRYFWGKRI